MDNPAVFSKLRELLLTDSEAKSYLALLEKETMTVTEVSRIAGIPRANAYEALEKLLARGFCISRPGSIKRYSATDPAFLKEKVVVDLDVLSRAELENLNEKLKRKQKEIIDKKKKEIRDRKDNVHQALASLTKELAPVYRRSRSNDTPFEYIEVLKEPLLVHKRLTQLFAEARSEVVVFVKPPYSGKRQLDEQVDQQAGLLRKGLTIRGIYEIPTEDEEKRRLVRNFERVPKQGEQSRVLKRLPMKMAIFDERIVLFALEDPVLRKTSLTSLVIEHESLARSLKILFETLWEQAEDYHVFLEQITKGGVLQET